MNPLRKIISCMLILLASLTASTAQDVELFQETSYIKCYGINEFGKLIFINHITEDSNGCIVLGTSDGITIIDSEHNTFYQTPQHSGINYIASDAENNFFAGGDVDLGYFENTEDGGFTFNPLSDHIDLRTEHLKNIFSVNGNVEIITDNAIYVFNYKKLSKIKFDRISKAYLCDTIRLLVTENGRLNVFDGRFTREVANLSKLDLPDPDNVGFVSISKDTIYMIGTGCFSKIAAQRICETKKITASEVTNIKSDIAAIRDYEIRDLKYDSILGRIAVATDRGIYIFGKDGRHLQTINYNTGLPLDDVRALHFDRKHNLWASLSSMLVKIELNTSTVYYTERQGITGDIYCFEKYRDKYYCSTFNDVYAAQPDNAGNHQTLFKKVKFNYKYKNITCWNLQVFEDRLIASTIDGLYQIDGLEANRILDAGKCYAIAQSPRLPGKLLIASFDGLLMADYSVADGKLTFGEVSRVKGLDFPVWSIEVDKRGMIWLGTVFNGLYYLNPKDGNIERYSIVKLGENINLKELRQPKFNLSDKKVRIYGSRVHIIDIPDSDDFFASEIKPYNDSILDKYLSNCKEVETYPLDSNGSVFINSVSNFVLAMRDGNGYRLDTVMFQTKISMINNAFLSDSLLFLSTNIGLVKHNINSGNTQTPGRYPFRAMINGICINDTSYIYKGCRYFDGDAPSISYGDDNLGSSINALKISYTTSCFENPELVTYSYKLEGRDMQWSAFSRESYHDFGALGPGSYTFKVRARNCEGMISNEACYSFVIESPIYARWWALLIYLILFITMLYLPLRRIVTGYKRENARLDRLARERYDEIIRQNERLKLLSLVASKNTNSAIILDGDGNFQWANNSFKNIYGYTFDEYKTEYGDNYFKTPHRCNPDGDYILANAIKNMEAVSYENCHIGPNNHMVFVQTHLDPVFDKKTKTLSNWIVTETDITQLKLAEKEGIKQAEMLAEAYMDLQKNQSKMEFQTRQLMVINERLEIGYKQIKRQNITINNSLRYAQSIQMSILPLDEKIEEFLDFFIIYRAKDIVSGDFYMFEKLNDNSFITIVADCTGHGVPGAFMSLIGYNILTQIIKLENITEPNEILELLSKKLIEMLKLDRIQNSDGMELSICRFNRMDGYYDVTFAGSGSSIYIYNSSRGELTRYKGGRRQIGLNGEIFNPQPFQQTHIRMDFSDRMYQYTDGIIDQCNEKRMRYGSPRLQKFLESQGDKSFIELKHELNNEINDYMINAEQRDDITIFGFNIKK